MENKIIEVQEYFKTKLLDSDFKIVNVGRWTATVIVDEKFEFSLWVGNRDIKGSVRIYHGSNMNFMHLDFSVAESEKIKKILLEDIKRGELERKQLELEELQKEIEKLKF
jgi:hypothetical protein